VCCQAGGPQVTCVVLPVPTGDRTQAGRTPSEEYTQAQQVGPAAEAHVHHTSPGSHHSLIDSLSDLCMLCTGRPPYITCLPTQTYLSLPPLDSPQHIQLEALIQGMQSGQHGRAGCL
jgi:hypothetical protein